MKVYPRPPRKVHTPATCEWCRHPDANIQAMFDVLVTEALDADERLWLWRIGQLFAWEE